MSCDPVDAQHVSEPTGVSEEMGTSHYCGGCTLSDALRFGEGFTTAEARCQVLCALPECPGLTHSPSPLWAAKPRSWATGDCADQ